MTGIQFTYLWETVASVLIFELQTFTTFIIVDLSYKNIHNLCNCIVY